MVSIIIEGENSKEAAEKLIADSSHKVRIGQLKNEKKKNSRLLDYVTVVEFFGDIAPIVVSFSGSVTLAYTIWKWRKELKRLEVIIQKDNGTARQDEMIVYKNSTEVEEIENFLEEE